ncbi:hypothetical protein B0H14DRAFT_2594153 [Mycena olivaceomarginata]|nr:hypothetical protein B0H14DRAFT_2594153 [Mycena olivaceomarginata]
MTGLEIGLSFGRKTAGLRVGSFYKWIFDLPRVPFLARSSSSTGSVVELRREGTRIPGSTIASLGRPHFSGSNYQNVEVLRKALPSVWPDHKVIQPMPKSLQSIPQLNWCSGFLTDAVAWAPLSQLLFKGTSDYAGHCRGYEGMQYNESLRLLVDLVTSPTQYYPSLAFSLAFGEAINDDDKDLAAPLQILNTFVRDINPNSHLVDTFSVWDLLPDFLSPWQAEARMKHQREIWAFNIETARTLPGTP